jgi:ubiquinone/menaquinone biosynthesis C-methylase UbiE
MSETDLPLFDRLKWRDPLSGAALEPIVAARTPAGVPIVGALRIQGTSSGYPIVDCVVRMTPESAARYGAWLLPYDLTPVHVAEGGAALQLESTVESFGFQWSWNSAMRSDADLHHRVLGQFRVAESEFADRLVLDAGAGAGDQSRYMRGLGAHVVSVDLSDAINVVASKLRLDPQWVGVQGDVTALPFASDQFDIVYCEGVIQHTRDSTGAVRELGRVTAPGGRILATHYVRQPTTSLAGRLKRKMTLGYYELLRSRLSRMERFQLLLWTGNLAALSYMPVLGRIVRWSGTAMYYDLMPEFRTTWTNTFDYYGNHAFQRFIEPEEFWNCFEREGTLELVHKMVGGAVARKRSGPAATTVAD